MFFIERTNKDQSFTVVFEHEDYDEVIKALQEVKSELRHEVWCEAWAHTDFGHSPMAWKN